MRSHNGWVMTASSSSEIYEERDSIRRQLKSSNVENAKVIDDLTKAFKREEKLQKYPTMSPLTEFPKVTMTSIFFSHLGFKKNANSVDKIMTSQHKSINKKEITFNGKYGSLTTP